MRLENIFLAGIGTCLPELVSTAEAVERGWYDAEAREASGIISVAVAGETPAPDMAVRAVNDAVKHSGIDKDDIGLLVHGIVHHQGPDGWSAPHYILRNTVDRPISALEVRHGCLSVLSAVELVSCSLLGNPDRVAAVICTADNFSTPHVNRWSSSGSFVMADSGSALVLSRRGGFARVLSTGFVSAPNMEELHRGGEDLFPPGITVGRSLNLEERTAYWRSQWANGVVPPTGHAGDIVVEAVDKALADAGVTMADIAKVAIPGVNWDLLETG